MLAANSATFCLSIPEIVISVALTSSAFKPAGTSTTTGWEYPALTVILLPLTANLYPTPTASRPFSKPLALRKPWKVPPKV